jgi:hypothetical protein
MHQSELRPLPKIGPLRSEEAISGEDQAGWRDGLAAAFALPAAIKVTG